MKDYEKELQTAVEAAKEASALISEIRDNKGFDIQMKGKNDLLTDADLASEQKIIQVLHRTYPNDAILAEESSQRKELPEGRVWIIDPIDGTTNFAHGFPVYCISIALWENKEAKVGLVLEIANQEWFTAIIGQGAYRNGEPISVSKVEDAGDSLIGTGFPYNDLGMADNYLRLLLKLMQKTHGIRRPGAAAWDLCNVACGRFDGFYEYGLNPWDVAAGALILKEAGGIVSDWKGGQNWLFGKRIITGNDAIHAFLKEQILETFNEDELED